MRALAALLLLLLAVPAPATACTGPPPQPTGEHFVFVVHKDGATVAEIDSGMDVAEWTSSPPSYCSTTPSPSRPAQPEATLADGFLAWRYDAYDLEGHRAFHAQELAKPEGGGLRFGSRAGQAFLREGDLVRTGPMEPGTAAAVVAGHSWAAAADEWTHGNASLYGFPLGGTGVTGPFPIPEASSLDRVTGSVAVGTDLDGVPWAIDLATGNITAAPAADNRTGYTVETVRMRGDQMHLLGWPVTQVGWGEPPAKLPPQTLPSNTSSPTGANASPTPTTSPGTLAAPAAAVAGVGLVLLLAALRRRLD